ncbi:MAG: phosphoglycerate kinase [Verrucomicrobia bacterium]|nr:phosphoglycerate kinase [Verrucomicrobiota bacterium]
MAKLSVRDLDVKGRRVLVRVDFNVPTEVIDGKTRITDDTRIRESLPTIELLREKGAKVVLLAHFGRPKGQPNPKYSLKPVADHLAQMIPPPVNFSPEVIGPNVEAASKSLPESGVLLVENVRFFKEEEANDDSFAKALAKLGDIYVNDAFGAAHRAHASTAGVARYMPLAAMGLLMERELQYLKDELAEPERPFLVILGGAKVSDKIGVIKALMDKADVFLIGGAMAHTFFKAMGIPTGASRIEADKVHLAEELLALAKQKGIRFLVPIDCIETDEVKPGANFRNTPVLSQAQGISEGWQGVDIGRETIALYKAEIARANTILWNGPVGVFEIPDFANGTREIAAALAESGAKTIIGGGDSVTAVKQFGYADKMTFISTGGGASLELLEGKELPGVAALTDK